MGGRAARNDNNVRQYYHSWRPSLLVSMWCVLWVCVCAQTKSTHTHLKQFYCMGWVCIVWGGAGLNLGKNPIGKFKTIEFDIFA